jgi:multidrug transporter EmrE-like cation transporter
MEYASIRRPCPDAPGSRDRAVAGHLVVFRLQGKEQSTVTLALILATLTLNILANSFVKAGMSGFAGAVGTPVLTYMTRSPHMYLGIGCYGLAFLSYSLLLGRLKLSVAYPLVTGSVAVALALVGIFYFGENFNRYKAGGILLVMAGLWLVAR